MKRAKIGSRQLRKGWTPKRAHSFALRRLRHIELLLEEIASTYSDVHQPVIDECDRIRDEALSDVRSALDEALEEERSI